MKMKLKLLFYRQNCNIEEQNQVNEVVALFQSILLVHTFNWSILGSAQLRYIYSERKLKTQWLKESERPHHFCAELVEYQCGRPSE